MLPLDIASGVMELSGCDKGNACELLSTTAVAVCVVCVKRFGVGWEERKEGGCLICSGARTTTLLAGGAQGAVRQRGRMA